MRKTIDILLTLFLILLAVFCGYALYEAYRQRSSSGGAADEALSSSADAPRDDESAARALLPDFAETAAVFPKWSGLTVLKINVRVGDSVREGQVLAEFDGAPLLENLRRLRSDAALAEKAYRAKLESGEADSREEAGKRLDDARRALADAQMKMGYRYVVSPVSGVLAERFARVGDAVREDAPLFIVGIPAPRSEDAVPASGDRP